MPADVLIEHDQAAGIGDIGVARRDVGGGEVERRAGLDDRAARIGVVGAGQLQRAADQMQFAGAGDRVAELAAAVLRELQLARAVEHETEGRRPANSLATIAQLRAVVDDDGAAGDERDRAAGQIEQAGAGEGQGAGRCRAGFGDGARRSSRRSC